MLQALIARQTPTISDLAPMDTYELCESGFKSWQEFRLADAARDFNLAIEQSPDFGPAYTGRGYVHYTNGQYHEAIVDFTEAIRLEPQDADAWKGRADSRQIIGELEAAIADYNEAIRLCPQVGAYFHRRGNALSALGKTSQAIEDYEQAIANDPGNPVSHYFLAALLAEQQEYAQALHHYREAIEIDPDHLDSFVYGCYAWILATCPDGSFRHAEDAIRIATTACEFDDWMNEQHLGVLAAAHAAAGDFREAIEWQQRAYDLATDDRKRIQQQRLDLYMSHTALFTTNRP